MSILKQIITLTKEQYETLIAEQQITVDGTTYYYDPNTLYMVPETEEKTQADWSETDPQSDSYIKNKPAITKITQHTKEYWSDHSTYVPEQGEVIIYSDWRTAQSPSGGLIKVPSMKLGDGTTIVSSLAFIDAGTLNGKNWGDNIPRAIDTGIEITLQPVDVYAAVGETARFDIDYVVDSDVTVVWRYKRTTDTNWQVWQGSDPKYRSMKMAAQYDGMQTKCTISNGTYSIDSNIVYPRIPT